MKLEIIQDGVISEPPLLFEDYDFMEELELLKTEFKPLIMNRSLVNYFGVDYGIE